MTWKRPWLGLLSVLMFGCNVSGEPAPARTSEDKATKIDACSLATRDEVGAIQGAKMLDPKSSEGPEIDFLFSQCYYSSAEPDKSVSLGLMQRNPKDGPVVYSSKTAFVIDWTIRMYEGAAGASFYKAETEHAELIAKNTTAFEDWARKHNRDM